MKTVLGFAAVCLVAASSAYRPSFAEAAEVKLLCAVAMKPAVDELAPRFEHLKGHKLVISYATAGVIRDKIRGGETFDAVVLPAPFMEPLVAQAAVTPDSMVLARSLISVGVRAGHQGQISAQPQRSKTRCWPRNQSRTLILRRAGVAGFR